MQKFRQSFVQSAFVRKLTTNKKRTNWFKPNGYDTGIRIYNCAARRKVPLIVRNEEFASWYTCGPTVYASSHLGHASCYVKLDIIQRILRQHFNINLVTAMNITDIDDKIIRSSRERGIHWRELAKFYENEFWSDMRKLNVIEPNLKVRVTESIPEITSFINFLCMSGAAYVGTDDSVYFNVDANPLYGKLQNLNMEEIKKGPNVEYKKSPADFALWKAKKSVTEPSWPSVYGDGRPGWHIECSALASMIFGETIDFHAGGIDLRFPHHENEEAQSCAYHAKQQWVNYWLHTGHLNLKGQNEKMSKSIGNTISISEMLTTYSGDEFRMACLLSNYRNNVEYGPELMETARQTLNRFKSFHVDCQAYLSGKKSAGDLNANTVLGSLKAAKNEMKEFFQDDFDTASVIGVLLEQVSNVSRGINNDAIETSNSSCLDVVAAIDNFIIGQLQIFGLDCVNQEGRQVSTLQPEIDLSRLLGDILQSRKMIRDQAVAQKSQVLFDVCDELRDTLREHGIEVRDHRRGSSWSFSSSGSKKS